MLPIRTDYSSIWKILSRHTHPSVYEEDHQDKHSGDVNSFSQAIVMNLPSASQINKKLLNLYLINLYNSQYSYHQNMYHQSTHKDPSVYYTNIIIRTYCFNSLTSNTTWFLPIHLLQNTADQQTIRHTLPVQANFQLTSVSILFWPSTRRLITPPHERYCRDIHIHLYTKKIIRTNIQVMSIASHKPL